MKTINSQFETVTYELHPQVAIITLNRPTVRNSFDRQLRQELLAALQLAEADNDIRIIIVMGAGEGFSAGQDLEEGVPAGDGVKRLLEDEYKPIIVAIGESDKLVIAGVNGAAAGIGAAIALACDFVVMEEDAYLFQAFVGVGLIPDGGIAWQLVNQLGYKKALETIIQGGKLTAKECLELGLANRVSQEGQLLNDTLKWAKELSERAPLAVRYTKKVLKDAQKNDLIGSIAVEASYQAVVTQSSDAEEGVKAFMEKRAPKFLGK